MLHNQIFSRGKDASKIRAIVPKRYSIYGKTFVFDRFFVEKLLESLETFLLFFEENCQSESLYLVLDILHSYFKPKRRTDQNMASVGVQQS